MQQVQGATCTSRKGRTILQASQGPSAFRYSQELASCAVCSFCQQSWNLQPATHETWTTKSDKLTHQLFFLTAICSPSTASCPKQQKAQAAAHFPETDTEPPGYSAVFGSHEHATQVAWAPPTPSREHGSWQLCLCSDGDGISLVTAELTASRKKHDDKQTCRQTGDYAWAVPAAKGRTDQGPWNLFAKLCFLVLCYNA